MERSDEYLLEMAMQGHSACFGELVQRWETRIYGFICRYVGNREEARDLTQNTFAKAYQNLDRLVDPARFSAWLYKIALNECRMRFRRRQRHQPVSLQEYLNGQPERQAGEDDPESMLLDRERVELLQRAFQKLPEEQKTVILMKEFQGMKFHEIAEVLDAPLSTIKSRMYLGLKTLRKLMETQS